jgi:hypothetical protein
MPKTRKTRSAREGFREFVQELTELPFVQKLRELTREREFRQGVAIGGSTGGVIVGSVVGATVGTLLLPGPGTMAGIAVGAAAGGFVGGAAVGGVVGHKLHKKRNEHDVEDSHASDSVPLVHVPAHPEGRSQSGGGGAGAVVRVPPPPPRTHHHKVLAHLLPHPLCL